MGFTFPFRKEIDLAAEKRTGIFLFFGSSWFSCYREPRLIPGKTRKRTGLDPSKAEETRL